LFKITSSSDAIRKDVIDLIAPLNDGANASDDAIAAKKTAGKKRMVEIVAVASNGSNSNHFLVDVTKN
jgi:hypothetical protein